MIRKRFEKKKTQTFSARRVYEKRQDEKKGPGRELNPGPPPDDYKP
jgi:hypothetical protein